MKKSKVYQKIITRLVEASFKNDAVSEGQVIKSIKILKSLPTYEAIQALSEYLSQLKRRQRAHTMYIETVIPLHLSQIKKVKKIVEKKVKITRASTHINPEILGGFRLRVGDEIWDESILGKISQVQEAIRG